jgi:hypothetical protein
MNCSDCEFFKESLDDWVGCCSLVNPELCPYPEPYPGALHAELKVGDKVAVTIDSSDLGLSSLAACLNKDIVEKSAEIKSKHCIYSPEVVSEWIGIHRKIDIKAEFKYNPIGSWKRGDPFTIAFIYPSKSKPFILKGGVNDIEKWLKGFKEPAIIHRSYWKRGKSRKSVEVVNTLASVFIIDRTWYTELWEQKNIDPKKKWAFIVDKNNVIVAMKRVPRKWIKELNPYISKEYVKKHRDVFKAPLHQDFRMIRI